MSMQILQAELAETRILVWGGKNENLPLMKPPATDEKMLAEGSKKNVELLRTD